MSNTDLILMGLGNLFRRKMRTVLTVLGVVIGATSILVMIAIGLGLDRRFEEEIQMFGALTKISISRGYGRDGKGGDIKFDDELVRKLSALDHVKVVVPFVRARGSLYYGKVQGWAEVIAIDFNLLSYLDIQLREGRFPQRGEVLVGNQVENAFWDYRKGQPKPIAVNPMKEKLEFKIEPQEWSEDVMKRKGMELIASGVIANEDYEMAQSIFISVEDYEEFVEKYNRKYKVKKPTAKEKKNLSKYSNIQVYAEDMDYVDEVLNAVREMELDGYSEAEWLNQAKSQSKMIQAVLGGVGGISLIVAAIGITNTMVMSIYERTKEIGVMKVIGAKVSDIRKLFLIEAAFIGFTGGIFGVGISYGIVAVINHMVTSPNPAYDVIRSYISELYLPPNLALLGIFFAMLIGMLAGLYPSIRATKISALDAIRTD